MTRARNVVPRLRRRRRLMRRAKGYWGARHKLLRTVKETLLRSGNFAYRDRTSRSAPSASCGFSVLTQLPVPTA